MNALLELQAQLPSLMFTGFEGVHCSINIDDCINNPCVNGVCVDKVNAYQCLCHTGKSMLLSF